jgi:hypothetical protein
MKTAEDPLLDGAIAVGGDDPARHGRRLRAAYLLGGDGLRRVRRGGNVQLVEPRRLTHGVMFVKEEQLSWASIRPTWHKEPA